MAELERRRAEIHAEIERIRGGALSLIDASGVRERFLHITDAARVLLSDFRAVEQNFRDLDRAVGAKCSAGRMLRVTARPR